MSLSPLAFGVSNVWVNAAIFAGVVVGGYVLVMWLAALLWTWRDIRSRTHDVVSQVICVSLVFVLNFPGLLLYLLLRPQETLVDRAEMEMEIDAFSREAAMEMHCPDCERVVEKSFVACPYCRAALAAPCRDCGRDLALTWIMCPFCLAPRTEDGGLPAPAATAAGQRNALLRSWRNPGRPKRSGEPAPVPANRNS